METDFLKNEWLVYHILSYGEDCTVLEPEELCEEIKEKLCNMLGKYK